MDQENPSPKRARRLHSIVAMRTSSCTPASEAAMAARRPGQVFLKHLQIEGFKTFCDRCSRAVMYKLFDMKHAKAISVC